MKLLPVLVGSLLAMTSLGAADTIVVGGNIVNQTWTAAGSPYVVTGDCTVPVGSTLTIQAGASVRFPNSDVQGAGLDTNRVEITVLGTLNINGTAGNTVTLHASSGTTPGTWFGIILDGGNATITYADLRHAVNGLTRANGAGTLVLTDSTFALNSGYGAKLFNLNASLDRLTFTDNATGLWFVGPFATVSRSTFTGNSQVGLRTTGGILNTAASTFSGNAVGFWGEGGGGTVASSVFASNTLGAKLLVNTGEDFWIVYNTFSHNPTALQIDPGPGGDSVNLSSTIIASATTGVKRMAGDASTIQASDLLFWSNGTDLDGVTATTSRVADPKFVNAPTDLHLTAGSAALSRGAGAMPYSSPDRDGVSRPQGAERDQGAYEFPAGANDAPVLGVIGAQSVPELSTLAFTLTSTEPDGEPSTFSAPGLPPGATLDADTGAFSWTPAAGALAGSPYSVTFSAGDGALTDSEVVLLTVTPPLPPATGGSGGGGCGLTGLELLALLLLRRRIK